MDEMRKQTLRKHHLIARILIAAAVIMMVVILFQPAFYFKTALFTRKSANTFVGDEKYLAVKAEVEETAASYESQGITDFEITEDVIERVNSKGQTTSMVTFTVLSQVPKRGIDFVRSSLPSGKILLAFCILFAGAVICALPFLERLQLEKNMSKGLKAVRSLAVAFAVFCLILVPAFFMMTTRTYNRTVRLYLQDLKGEESLPEVTAAGEFLFGEKDSDAYKELLSGVDFEPNPAFWLLLPAVCALIIGCVLLRHNQLGPWLKRFGIYLFVIVLCIVFLYPYYVMTITGFRSSAETNDMHFLHMLPTKWVFSNLTDIMKRGIPQYLGNSLLLAGGATLISLICGIPAAFALSRMHFKGKKIFLGFIIMSQMFSPVVLLVGISSLMKTIHLNDSILGLTLINAAFNQAFAIWLLYGTFSAISPEMEQAATIDGCSRIESLFYVLLPMAAPGIVTALIFVFINSWNEYTISTVLISTVVKKPITVGITQFSSFNMIEWPYLFASSLLATIPVVILFLCIEKHLVSGLTSGGVKG